MKNKRIWTKLATVLLLGSLVACQPGKRRSEMGSKNLKLLFPQIYESKEKEIKGGTFKVGVTSSTSFSGLLSPLIQTTALDGEFSGPIDAPLFVPGKDFKVSDKGLAKIDVDVDNKVVTVTLRPNLKWDDGQPMTIDDYIFTYEVVAHPDYTGVRYDESVQQVNGIKDYHEGKAKTISGLEKVNDTTVKIHFNKLSPAVYNGGGGLLPFIAPKHDLKDVPVKDLEKSEKTRLKVVGAGQYKIKQIVPGESIEYVPNEYYYKKDEMPKVDSLIKKILPDNALLSSMKNGEYDEYSSVPSDLYQEYKDFNNLVVLGRPQLGYSYLGFDLGHWDAKKGENVTDPDKKMADINLRKAMGYALNVEEVINSFYSGLKTRATGVIPPVFESIYNSKPSITYNVKKANELLDKAGYKDVNGDGIREDKNGKPLEIIFGMTASGDIAEPLTQKFIQDWRKVGLKVSLAGGRLLESNSFFEKLQSNNKGFDIWMAGWSVASSLDLNGIYGNHSKFNIANLASARNNELIDKVNSLEALKDPEYRLNAIKEWENNYMENELGFLPLWFSYELFPINKRVKFETCKYDNTDLGPHPTAVTSQQTLMAK